MMEITPDGHCFYIQRSGDRAFFGTLGHERPSGHRTLTPTTEFWKAWGVEKDVLRSQLGFRVRKHKGQWTVDMARHAYHASGIVNENATLQF